MKRLAKLMSKSFRQVAFDAVRDADWVDRQAIRREKILRKFLAVYLHRRKHFCMHLWKQILFFSVNESKEYMRTQLHHRVKNAQFERKEKQENVSSSGAYTQQWKVKKKIFMCLYDYRCKKIFGRHQQVIVADKLKALRQRWSLQKWKARAIKTQVST